MGIQEFLLDRAKNEGVEIGVQKGSTQKELEKIMYLQKTF